MKQNETLDQKELESINSEIFHSFDPDDASWVMGGFKYTAGISPNSNGNTDVDLDFIS
jgi:hypothetical protein